MKHIFKKNPKTIFSFLPLLFLFFWLLQETNYFFQAVCMTLYMNKMDTHSVGGKLPFCPCYRHKSVLYKHKGICLHLLQLQLVS